MLQGAPHLLLHSSTVSIMSEYAFKYLTARWGSTGIDNWVMTISRLAPVHWCFTPVRLISALLLDTLGVRGVPWSSATSTILSTRFKAVIRTLGYRERKSASTTNLNTTNWFWISWESVWAPKILFLEFASSKRTEPLISQRSIRPCYWSTAEHFGWVRVGKNWYSHFVDQVMFSCNCS